MDRTGIAKRQTAAGYLRRIEIGHEIPELRVREKCSSILLS